MRSESVSLDPARPIDTIAHVCAQLPAALGWPSCSQMHMLVVVQLVVVWLPARTHVCTHPAIKQSCVLVPHGHLHRHAHINDHTQI